MTGLAADAMNTRRARTAPVPSLVTWAITPRLGRAHSPPTHSTANRSAVLTAIGMYVATPVFHGAT
jgi:hypothetical protein